MNPLGCGLFAIVALVAYAQPPAEAERALALNDRALATLAQGDPAAAKTMFSEALQIWLSLGKQFEAHAATGLMNLGDALCTLGQWSEGAKLFEQSLELNRRSLGPNDTRTLGTMNRLANAYAVQGEPDRAEPLYREALAIERELYPGLITTGHTLLCLASLHSHAGKTDLALPEAEEGLAITLKAVGENDSDAGFAYASVAQIYRILGRSDRALPLLRKALVIFERTLGPKNPRVGSVLSQEGLALLQENKLALAERDLVRAVDLLSQPAAIDVELAVAEQNLGLLRIRQKKYAEADRLLSSALAIQEHCAIRPGAEMADTLRILSGVREKERLFEDAAQLKSRAATILSYR